MKAIQNAFEQYYADNTSVYPSANLSAGEYLPNGMPSDPKGGSYIYVTDYDSDCNPYCYCACAQLEGSLTAGNSSDASCSFGSGQYYCVNNLQ